MLFSKLPFESTYVFSPLIVKSIPLSVLPLTKIVSSLVSVEVSLTVTFSRAREESPKDEKTQEIQTDKKPKISFKNFKTLDKKLKYFLMIAMLFTLGNSSNQFLFLRSKNIGFSAANIILLYLVYNIVYAFVSYPAGIISDRIGRKKILVAGYFFYGLVYFGFALAQDAISIWILFALYGLYIGLTEGIEKAFISDVSPTDKKATILGLHATIVGIGLFPASFLAGILWTQLGPEAPFIMGGITGVLSAVLLLLLI